MATLSSKCATTASLLALATLPSHHTLTDPPITHEDFASARGYIRRTIHGKIVHAVDWDGTPGIESIVRESGRRSEGLWKEFRAWRATNQNADSIEAGNMACSLLLKHFGPYHQATSDALSKRRALQREKTEATRSLESECPLALRVAARDYLSQHFGYLVKMPPPLPFLPGGLASGVEESTNSFPLDSRYERSVGSPFSGPESVLREFMLTNLFLTNATSLEDAAKSVLSKARAMEETIDMLDMSQAIMRLPPIPGERQPADMDLINYGALICRHRAVVVGVLLADAGFDVEVVEGSVGRDGNSGGHLFVYSAERGILEPSADGPNFWRRMVSATEENNALIITVDDGTTYRFGNRTPLRACRDEREPHK